MFGDPVPCAVRPGQSDDVGRIKGSPNRSRGQRDRIKHDYGGHGGLISWLANRARIDQERSPLQTLKESVGLAKGYEVKIEVAQEIELLIVGI